MQIAAQAEAEHPLLQRAPLVAEEAQERTKEMIFSYFEDDGHKGVQIPATGQRWFLEHREEIEAFARFLNNAAQQSAQTDALSRESCPECFGYGGFHSDNCSHIAARR